MNFKNRLRETLNATGMEALQAVAGNTVTVPEPIAAKTTPPLICSPLSDSELSWQYRLRQKLLEIIDLAQLSRMAEKEARTQIREVCQRLMEEDSVPLNTGVRQLIIKAIEDDIFGLGLLETLLAEPSVSDILVNGYNHIYVERFGKLELTPLKFQSESHLMNIIDRIVSSVGRRIDESIPMVDARLQDGSRVNAIIPPLALDGACLSIRKFAAERLKMADLTRLDTLNDVMGEVLQGIVKARLNVLISGGTGSGKTTLLNVLSGFIPENERIITIEDSAELQMQQPHVVRLETRLANIEGKGEVLQRDLVRNSLRMRPDRIIIGEVRGEETFDMLQAMNTGHDGSLATVHANSPRDALARLENMVAMTGIELPVKAVRSQIASAIDIIVQLVRLEDGKRKLVSIQEVDGMEGDIITLSEIFRFQRKGLNENGEVVGQFKATGIVPKFHERLQKRGIHLGFELFDPK